MRYNLKHFVILCEFLMILVDDQACSVWGGGVGGTPIYDLASFRNFCRQWKNYNKITSKITITRTGGAP